MSGQASRQINGDDRDADDAQLGQALLRLARDAIEGRLSGVADNILRVPEWARLPRLEQAGATFVTLSKSGQLRGCIGSLEAHRPLHEDVRENALAAAFRDPRFPAVSAPEWPAIAIEVSLLGAAEALPVHSEEALCRQLRPHRDGLIMRCRNHRATFLPQVWEQLPAAEDFVAQLKHKAGLAAGFWSPEMEIQRYEVRQWKEQ